MFICKTNAVYSQIAEGFAKHLGVGSIQVTSAGLAASQVNPMAISTMNEAGVNISRQTSKVLSDFNPQDFDIVISLCGDAVELPLDWIAAERFENWPLAASDHPPDILSEVRDQIRERVIHLIESLDTSH
jgi:arsenate reductase